MKANFRKAIAIFALVLSCSVAFAQNVTVKGVVTDSNNLPIIGAAVLEKGHTSNGVATDLDGNYTLTVPAGATLEFSCIGYVTVEKPAVNGTLNVTLADDAIMMEETVVIGYGVQKKSDVTGAIASVNSDVLKNRSVDDVAAAFAGKTSGVQVLGSGSPGSIGTIRIRGVSSNSSAASDPLYIVDGLQVANIGAIDPQNVKSIEILKDAASAAIYGAQAGNGVVLITTKSGEKGEGKIFYNGSVTLQNIGYHPTMMNAKQYMDFMLNSGNMGDAELSLYDGHTDTDWYSAVFETGIAQRHTVGFQGANDKGSFYAALSYLNNDGIVVDDLDGFKRVNVQLNADYQIKKWLKVGTTNTFQTSKSTGIGGGGVVGGVYSMDPLTAPTYTDANLPDHMRLYILNGNNILKTPDGEYIATSVFNERTSNPLASLYTRTESHRNNINLNGTMYMNITPFKGLTYTSRLGYLVGAYESGSYTEPWYISALSSNPNYDLNNEIGYNFRYQWENFANYSHKFGQNHQFDAMAGMSFISESRQFVRGVTNALTGYGDNFRYLDYSAADAADTITGSTTESASLSYFGRLGYTYANKYTVQATFRADAFDSSKLSSKNRWGLFPSVSLGWTISNEEFMSNVSKDALSFLKLRTSWGINGNVGVLSNYQYASTVRIGGQEFSQVQVYQLDPDGEVITPAAFPNKLANENLSWEKSKQVDVGIDARFLRDRLTATLDYYHKNTSDLIVDIKPPYITGHQSAYVNAGAVRNQGVEFDLGWKDAIGDFHYSISGNISHNSNMTTYLEPTVPYINGYWLHNIDYATRFQEGYPVWYFYGYKFEGIAEDGSPIYADLDGSGTLTSADRTNIGDGQADFNYGLTLSAEYKGFDFTLFGSGSYGNDIWFASIRNDYPNRNLPAVYYTDGFEQAGKNAKYPKANTIFRTEYMFSSANVYDGSYFRINQIQLGYNLPEKVLGKVGLSNARVYVSMDDYFTFSKYVGFDPVTASINSGNALGIDTGSYPSSKKIMFGLNLTF